jgi:putative FmdB family regulatory protein
VYNADKLTPFLLPTYNRSISMCARAAPCASGDPSQVPIYEYECKQCGNRFERIQKFSDPRVESCPKCAGKVEQVLTAAAVQFKGSGWYATDYARKSGSPAKSDTKDAGGSGESDSAGKSTEKKTESKTEASGESNKASKDKSDNRGSRD